MQLRGGILGNATINGQVNTHVRLIGIINDQVVGGAVNAYYTGYDARPYTASGLSYYDNLLYLASETAASNRLQVLRPEREGHLYAADGTGWVPSQELA